jgi:hypothetical protein
LLGTSQQKWGGDGGIQCVRVRRSLAIRHSGASPLLSGKKMA